MHIAGMKVRDIDQGREGRIGVVSPSTDGVSLSVKYEDGSEESYVIDSPIADVPPTGFVLSVKGTPTLEFI